jgi:internalin A
VKMRIVCLALLVLAVPTGAAEINKSRLRELAKLPTITFEFGVKFSTSDGFVMGGRKPDYLAEIARIRKDLTGDDRDAERYLRMGVLYAKLDRGREAKEASQKAVDLCRQQAKAHPDDMSRLALLGEALVCDNQGEEGEALLRRAVKTAPKEWRAWLVLGKRVDDRAAGEIVGDMPLSAHFIGGKAMLKIFEKKPQPEKIAGWRSLHEEALRCFERAVALAPRETRPYVYRAGSIFKAGLVEAGLQSERGKQVDLMKKVLTPAYASDLRTIARLSADEPSAVGTAIILEIMYCFSKGAFDRSAINKLSAYEMEEHDPSLVDCLEHPSRDFVRWGMDRLEQLTKCSDEKIAADASENLAWILMFIHKPQEDMREDGPPIFEAAYKKAIPKIIECLRRTVRLDPTCERAWDFLTFLLAEKASNEEALDVAKRRLKSKDNAHNRFLLAKLFADNKQFDFAEEQLRIGLNKDQDDLNCRLGLAAILLRREDAKALKSAEERLDKLEPLLKNNKSKEITNHYGLLRGIAAALNDNREGAKKKFNEIIQIDSENVTAKKALFYLGEWIGPGRESEAIAWIEKHGGKIRREGGRKDGPVVRVVFGNEKTSEDTLLYLSAFPQLRSLIISGSDIGDDDLEFLEPLKHLSKLQILSGKIAGFGLAHLASLEHLTALQISSKKFTDSGLIHIKKLKKLRSLVLSGSNIHDEGLVHLEALTQLRRLSLEDTNITDSGLVHLKTLRHLETLFLPGKSEFETSNQLRKKAGFPMVLPAITEVGLAHLRGLTFLRTISLEDPLTDDGLAHLAKLPHLHRLTVAKNQLTDEGMKQFERCKQLRVLNLGFGKFGDAGVEHLKGLENLRELDLEYSKITDEGLAHLKGLTRLEKLNLSGTAISDKGLGHLRELTRLRELVLSNQFGINNPAMLQLLALFPGKEANPSKKAEEPRVTDDGLKYLEKMTALEYLDLSNQPITDMGLESLEHLNRLEALLIRGTEITDAGLTHLYKLRRLRTLELFRSKVTDQGVKNIKKVIPKLSVTH